VTLPHKTEVIDGKCKGTSYTSCWWIFCRINKREKKGCEEKKTEVLHGRKKVSFFPSRDNGEWQADLKKKHSMAASKCSRLRKKKYVQNPPRASAPPLEQTKLACAEQCRTERKGSQGRAKGRPKSTREKRRREAWPHLN